MPITSLRDEEKQLTVFTATGELSFDEIRNAITSFYEGDYTLKVLWDMRDATARAVSSKHVDQIENLLEKYRQQRSKGIKTAIVTPTDLDYGISRMLVSIAEIREKRFPVLMNVFRTMDEALNWIS